MVDAGHHILVGDDFVKTLGGELLEEHYGVLAGGTPEVMVKVAEEVFGLAVPHPPEVA